MKNIIVHGNLVTITESTIVATCEHFAGNAQGCIDEVLSGEVKVNNQESYIQDCLDRKEAYLQGNYEPTLAFWQKAYYIQSGDCVGLLG